MNDDRVKRIFVIGLVFLLALWLGTYIDQQIRLHQIEQRFNHNSYQPLRGNQ